ncbi:MULTISPECIES: hypothetical protein [Chelativorans]|jgi:hypothetical protein|nr:MULTISPECIES: hypothetical protein [Chelativorans]
MGKVETAKSTAAKNVRPLTKWVRTMPMVGRGVEVSLSLLEQLGIKGFVMTSLPVIIYGWAAWFFDYVPWWAAILLLLAAIFFVLGAAHRILLIRTASRFDPSKYEEFGQELVDLSKDMFRFLSDRMREQRDHHARMTDQDPVSIHSWQADRDFEQISGRLFFERFGPQTMRALALLQRIGVQLPPHMIATASHRQNGIPQFLGLMGQLLEEGNVSEAIEISQDRDFIWQIQH